MSDTKACYEHWADADISFLTKGKDRLMSACTLHYCTLCFSWLSTPDHPPLLMASSTMLVLLRRPSTSLYPDSY